MRYTLFGGSGLRVSELFLGAMTFGEQGGVGAPAGECARILGAYADAGGNVIDTAINYRGGASEEIVGELRPRAPERPGDLDVCYPPEVIGEQHSRRHRAEACGDRARLRPGAGVLP